MYLVSLAKGEKAKVISTDDSPYKKRLNDLGIIKGCVIEKIRTSFFGTPVEYKAEGFFIALDKCVAESIRVEKL